MRLLLRANSHRVTEDGSLEVAASPDTPDREPWRWNIRIEDADLGSNATDQEIRLEDSHGTVRLLQVSTDPESAQALVEVHDVASRIVVRRQPAELLVLLVHRGEAMIESRHLLAEMDALVLEGNDPVEVSVDSLTHPLGLAVVRLRPNGGRPLAWVP